ncbi:MAG: hypothetical protein LBU43_00035 [Candidatus Accumulibacter sp.]|jgi:hypothetical protein|nr:hypothetical protein [Accumulibacter sp.]
MTPLPWSKRAWARWLYGAFPLIAALPIPALAEELERLFFTPEYRRTLDWQRQFGHTKPEPDPAPDPERNGEISDAEPTLTIDGVVLRSGGKRTVWINGVALDDLDAANAAVTPDRANPGQIVVHSANGPDTPASVGDTVNRNTGETTDLLDGGRIHITKVK